MTESRGSDSISSSVLPSCEINIAMLQKNPLIKFEAKLNDLETKRGEGYTLPCFCNRSFSNRSSAEQQRLPILDVTFHLSKWLLDEKKFGRRGVILPEISPENRYNKKDNSTQIDFCYLLDTLSFPPMKKHLANFDWSISFKSDIAILYKREFPVFVIKIDSSTMTNTIAKLAANLIDFLRYMRHFDVDSVNELTGFAFPKLEVKGYVAAVTVTWKELRFHVSVIRYGLSRRNEVDLMLKKVFESQLNIAKKLHACVKEKIEHYFIPFSASDVALLKKGILSSSLQQVNSRFSLLFTNEDFYFKCCPVPEQREQLELLRSITSTKIDRLVLPVDKAWVPSTRLCLFKFEKQQFPLSLLDMDQRISCLHEIAYGVKAALEQLHDLGFAHLDVRIHNVCYHQGNVTLIDFDRARSAEDNDQPPYKGYMYEASSSSTCGDLDWKQLGLLIHSIQERSSNSTKLNEASVKTKGTSLVQSLVFQYTWLDDNDLNDIKYIKTLEEAMEETKKKDGSGATEDRKEDYDEETEVEKSSDEEK